MGLVRIAPSILALVVSAASAGTAQEASFVYRLGRDTLAIEQYHRTGNRIVGEAIVRGAAAISRMQYDVTFDRHGRVLTAAYRTRAATGSLPPDAPSEIRLTFGKDSIRREAIYADSVNTRMLPALNPTPFQFPAFGLWETAFARLRKAHAKSMTFAAVNSGTGIPQNVTLTVGSGDTIYSSTGAVYRVDADGKLLGLDMTSTTQKITAERAPGGLVLHALARALKPFGGPLSGRGSARATFLQSPIFIDYGRPYVRGRSVWGGTLIPFDTIWRAGANEATHLAASRELTFGNLVVPPGLYTLWIYNSRVDGPQLLINRRVGASGGGPDSYDAAQDIARVPMTLADTSEFVEQFTITVRPTRPGHGTIEFAWGDKVATAAFTVRP